MNGSDVDEEGVDDGRLTRARSSRIPYVFKTLDEGEERRLRVESRARALAASRAAANVAAREHAAAAARAAAMTSAAASSAAPSVAFSSGPLFGMPTGSAGTSSSSGSRQSTSQMAGSQFSPLTPREREMRELQQVERIREQLEKELKEATDREKEIKYRAARLETLESDKADLEGLDDSGMNEPMKVLRNNMLSLHAHVDSRLDFMQSTLDQILDILTRPGFRPPAQSSLPLSAMSGPFPVQADVSEALEDLEGEWSNKDPRESWVALKKGPRGEHFVVEVDVGGRKCGAFIDIGSTRNYISHNCLERLHLQDRVRHLSRPVASTLANKERMIVTNYIKDVVCTFSYGGGELNHKISFLVSDDLPIDMLLGMYYLEVAKPQFDWDKKVLKHKLPDGRTVRLTKFKMGSQLQMTSGNHPEANGQAEQMNRVVQHLLRHYIKPNQDDWDEQLPLIASLFNNAIHSSTGVSPNQLHLGWKPRSALDFLLPENRPTATLGTLEYGVQYEKLLQEAVEHMKKAQQTMIASENQHRRQSTFQVGERVWVKASELGQEFGISRKLMPQYFGPWEVLDVVGDELDGPTYVIRVPGHLRTHPVFHASKLAPFSETDQFPSRRPMLPPTMDGQVDIDDIVDHRDMPVQKPLGRGRPLKPRREYRIRFRHHTDPKEDRWFTREELMETTPQVVADYERKLKGKAPAK
ncbi:hypothetical protein CBR_g46785 [Chara braunii]|uniref:Integrase catalytic domain-containing protein n=1 Tax=Chara braunii TaxID=69332 RepID=A0A388M0X3_CHABU|nr:hypothetical protein CBR_g46785 [Chara braunii]|eukprot:GBG88218.1 hypothetical protein CBR_g46785 [Chara braunii]